MGRLLHIFIDNMYAYSIICLEKIDKNTFIYVLRENLYSE